MIQDMTEHIHTSNIPQGVGLKQHTVIPNEAASKSITMATFEISRVWYRIVKVPSPLVGSTCLDRCCFLVMLNRSFGAKQRVLEVCFLSGWDTFVANGLWLSSRYGYRCYRIGGQNSPGISRNNELLLQLSRWWHAKEQLRVHNHNSWYMWKFFFFWGGGAYRFTAFRAWCESILSPPHYCKTLQIPLILWLRLQWNPKFQQPGGGQV